jgi:hypothetical protein
VTKQTGKSFAGTLSFLGAVARAVSHSMSATLALGGTVVKATSRALSAALSFVGGFIGSLVGAAAPGRIQLSDAAAPITADDSSADIGISDTAANRITPGDS